MIGFALASSFAVIQKWSLPEFCWSTWIAGLVYAWACVITAAFQIILTAPSEKETYEDRIPFFKHISWIGFLSLVLVLIGVISVISVKIYNYLFAFYGLFLSFFAEMEPHSYFGRDGFINSDFFSPVRHLIVFFWPMALGTLVANWKDFIQKNPWKRIFLPFQAQILKMHVMIVALPFLALIAWALFGEKHQAITILLLMALFYLLPKNLESPQHPESS